MNNFITNLLLIKDQNIIMDEKLDLITMKKVKIHSYSMEFLESNIRR